MAGDYFSNPKKDDKPRRGRPPGSKNKKTIEAEKRVEVDKMKKSKVKKYNDIVGEVGSAIADIEGVEWNSEELYTGYGDCDVDVKLRLKDGVDINDVIEAIPYDEVCDVEDMGDRVYMLTVLTGIPYDKEEFDAPSVKSKTEKSYFGEYDANLVNIINASENITHGAKIMQRELDKSFKDENLLNPENYDVAMTIADCISTIRTEIDKIQKNADSLDSFARTYVNEDGTMKSKTEKSVTFKGYDGTWNAIAKAGHYTMWQSVEMKDKAYNIITQTKKNSKTGKLVEKIVMEDVDGFEDKRVAKTGLKKGQQEYSALMDSCRMLKDIQDTYLDSVSGSLSRDIFTLASMPGFENYPLYNAIWEQVKAEYGQFKAGVKSLISSIIDINPDVLMKSVSKKEKVGILMDNLSQGLDETLREFAEKYGIDTNEDNWKKKVFEKMVEEDGYDPTTIDQHLGYYDLNQKE